jgi:1-acyl-sn-glycerol-3-phosphate acyltransferase
MDGIKTSQWQLASHCLLGQPRAELRHNLGYSLVPICGLHYPPSTIFFIMHQTVFTTPLVNTLLRAFSIGFLRLAGWKVLGSLPAEAQKSVFIAAPHTSNWDLPYTLMVAFALQLNIYWMGKASLFNFPFGPLMRWLGGIAVDRSKSNNLVSASAQAIQAANGPLQLIVPPEGTRSKTRYWKTGFYHIAVAAQVPIVMAYMDYERKISGLGPMFVPTGDLEADMVRIKAFYAPFKGKNAAQFGSE